MIISSSLETPILLNETIEFLQTLAKTLPHSEGNKYFQIEKGMKTHHGLIQTIFLID